MPGRPLIPDDLAALRGFGDGRSVRRRAVLRETIQAFSSADPPDKYVLAARDNLARWAASAEALPEPQVMVLRGDWGDVAQRMTRASGACFAVLNMANAYVPGGAYVEGAVAQEENMYRRTDCHFYIDAPEYDTVRDQYQPELTRLLCAEDGVVYLDARRPRVCIRGPELPTAPDLGYRWLDPQEVFPFYELRSAAQDLRGGSPFDAAAARKRIKAQLDTLIRHRIRHVILGAHGCGAFGNPASEIAPIYRDEIDRRLAHFSVIAFAIYAPGYGPDNYTPFAQAFG